MLYLTRINLKYMIDRFKDLISRLKIALSINRLTFKDYIYNIGYGIRFQILRRFFPNKIHNASLEYKKGMKLVFKDYFTTKTWNFLRGDNWLVGEHWGDYHPDRLNVYYDAPTISNGHTLFTVKYCPKKFLSHKIYDILTIPYQVSLLSSAFSNKQQYGRFECRMTLPKGKGVWPAFWLWGVANDGKDYIEIDIYEGYGRNSGTDTIYQECNIHYGTENYSKHIKPWITKIGNRNTIGKKYHEFAVEWRSDKIEFYTDGIKIFQYTNKTVLDRFFNQPDSKMWIVINNSLKEGYTDSTSYYSKFKVDYIRAYELTD
jgi:hypothetical protein